MRRSLIALTTAAALSFSIIPAAQAQSSGEVQGSLAALPAEFRVGSSAVETLQEGSGTEEELQQGSSELGRDWLIGLGVTTLLGMLITALSGMVG